MSVLIGFNNFICQNVAAIAPEVQAISGGVAVSGFPKENFITENYSNQVRRSAANSVTIDTLFYTTDTDIGRPGIGALSIANLYFTNATGLKVQVQLSASGYGVTPWFDQTRIVHKSSSGYAPQNAVFVVDACATDGKRAAGGDPRGGVYCRVILTDNTSSSGYIGAGGLQVWQCFRAEGKEASMTLESEDASKGYWPSAGYPFFNRRTKSRKLSAVLNGISTPFVFGGTVGAYTSLSDHNYILASISAINSNAGQSWPVLWIPDSSWGTSAASSAVPSASYSHNMDRYIQSAHMLGFLDAPIRARQIAQLTPDGTNLPSTWEADFSMTEVTGA